MAKKKKEFVQELTSKSEDYSQWYIDVIKKADMADYTSIKGCMVIKPYGFALWENIKAGLDKRIKATGHKNAYFPLLVPESLLQLEASHIEGFAPEVAWVTHGGEEKLEERLAIRPTSEAIICSLYSKWIQSYRDLPLLINQWANVVRWEKVTRPFLRTTEFLWQEGHTCHRTQEEAEEETLMMLKMYKEFIETELAIPVVLGMKTDSERFAGAVRTYTVETMMGDGKALQAGTSHNLGQRFAKVFNIKFLDEDQTEKFVWQTSWGVSTRLIGAVVMAHGDDFGLVLPPIVAPTQVMIVPIIFEKTRQVVLDKTKEIADKLADFRVECDTREEYTPGWKYNEYEMKGIPLRIEIGPKDIEKKQVVIVLRGTREKLFVPEDQVAEKVKELLDDVQSAIFNRAKEFLDTSTRETDSYDEFKEIIENKRGFVISGWCGSEICEALVKAETKATIRCIPLEGSEPGNKKCIHCNKDAVHRVYFARSY